MHCSRRRIFMTTAFALLTLIVAASSAQAANDGNSENAKLCQKDGWMKLATSTGAPFTSTGECVAYAARGGALSPKPAAGLAFDIGTCFLTEYGFFRCPDATLVGWGLSPEGVLYQCVDDLLIPSMGRCYPFANPSPDGTFARTWEDFQCRPGVGYTFSAPAAKPDGTQGVLVFAYGTCPSL